MNYTDVQQKTADKIIALGGTPFASTGELSEEMLTTILARHRTMLVRGTPEESISNWQQEMADCMATLAFWEGRVPETPIDHHKYMVQALGILLNHIGAGAGDKTGVLR